MYENVVDVCCLLGILCWYVGRQSWSLKSGIEKNSEVARVVGRASPISLEIPFHDD